MSTETTELQVRTTIHDHICVISLDNAAKKNAISPEMMQQLSKQLTTFDDDDNLWVAVLDPAGEHTTAGLDMPKFFGPGASAKPIPSDQVDPLGLGRRCRKPLIAVVHGITYTVGIEMMLAGDIVVAAEGSRFCQMESRRGIAPLGGAHFRYITRSGWGNAMYHLMLCDEFDATEALRVGLVQEVVPAGTQIERAMELARIITANAPLGIQVMKAAGRQFIAAGEKAAIDMLPTVRERVMDTEDAREGIQSFVERRRAVFKGR